MGQGTNKDSTDKGTKVILRKIRNYKTLMFYNIEFFTTFVLGNLTRLSTLMKIEKFPTLNNISLMGV